MLRAIFLLSLIFTAYSCGFQQLQRPPLQFIDTVPHDQPEGRMLQQSYESIRIYADYSYLDSIDPILKDYIQNQIMPSAIDYYQTALKIIRLTENLKTSASCAGYSPPAYLADPGVEADLIILVVAEDWPDVSFVAGALPCGLSLINNRPVYGLMLFNLAYLPYEKVTDNQENLSTALHELCHVFGFNSDFYNYFINPTTGATLSGLVGQKIVNDNYVTFLDVEPLTSKLRAYFSCDSLEGAYLEDEGDSGSAGSHFERRIFMNEFMTASSITEPVISEFTLALLEGTGWYQPNYNMTEPFNWGRGQGCDFVDGPCVSTNGTPNFFEFCSDDVDKACSFTSRGIGFCATGSNADYFANGCPYYMSSPVFDCEDPTNQVSALISGEVYGPSSRCFTGTLVDSFYSASYGAYCFTTSCAKSGDNFILTLTIDGNNITCASEGPVSVAGYNGQLNCPDPNEFCTISNPTFCEKGCSGRGTCVDNVCQCPDGWGGADCAERLFDLNCARCQNETGKGCYGDQCLARDEIILEDPIMTEEEDEDSSNEGSEDTSNEGDEETDLGELEDIGWGNGSDGGEYSEEEDYGFEEEEGEGGLEEEDYGDTDIGNTDDNPVTDPDDGSQYNDDSGNTDDNSNDEETEEEMPHKVTNTTKNDTTTVNLDIDDGYDRKNHAEILIVATTSFAILLTLIV